MQAINNRLVDLVGGRKQFIIPAFQRDYSWTTEQCDQLWNDIVRAGSREGADHFLGSIVYVAGDTVGAVFSSWLVIDGQQRLATLTLLLVALRDHIQDTNWTGEEPTSGQIDAFYLKNEHDSGDRRYKVALRRHDDVTLRALVDGKDPLDVESASELVVDVYQHFRMLLKSGSVQPDTVYKGIANLKVVDVTLHHGIDDPQRVFESLNSTGVDLTQSDLIRNYLLMGLPEPEQTKMYDNHWMKIEMLFRQSGSDPDNFLRDYIAIKQKSGTQTRADRIYTEFKGFWQPSNEQALTHLLKDLARFAGYFVDFLRPERIDYAPLSTEMRQTRSLGSAQAILVMRLYECYDRGTLSADDFARALNLISSYIVRRSVLGLQTRGYWSVFARIAHYISDESPFEDLQVALARNYQRFPSDSEFKSAMRERNLYGLRNCWHILAQLENAGLKEPSPVNTYSIEHIMPQSIEDVLEWKCMLGDGWEDVHETWLHRLGNLTLTGYNSSYSNRPFEEKKTIEGGFRQSAVRLNEYVRNKPVWTASEMEERGSMLADRAVEVWPHHGADQELILASELQDLRMPATRKSLDSLNIGESAHDTFYAIRDSIRSLGESIEIVEGRSLCYYDAVTANFFAETLPMAGYVRVLLPIDFEEVVDPEGMAKDVTAWKFLTHVTHRDCGVFLDVWGQESLPPAIAVIRQAYNVTAQ